MKKLSKKNKIIVLVAIILIAIILALIITTNIEKNNRITSEDYLATTANASSSLVASYIKEGVTIGGITGTLEVLDTSDANATPEDIMWGETAYVKGKKITGTYRILGMLKVGDYVKYEPDSAGNYTLTSTESGYTNDQTINQENLNWRILSINKDGTVDLISETPTSQSIYFGGATGYNNNNGVYLLNDISAKLYSNSNLKGTARSMNIDDIEAGFTEAGLEYANSFKDAITVGETKTYTGNYTYYPNLYAKENGSGIDLSTTNDPNSEVKTNGIGQSDNYYSEPTTETYTKANTSLTITQTLYAMSIDERYYKDSTFYSLICGVAGGQWIASRFVSALPTHACFGIRRIIGDGFRGYELFNSRNIEYDINGYLRPVVSLKSNIRLGTGDGSKENPYVFL